jgi:hypothetical protein
MRKTLHSCRQAAVAGLDLARAARIGLTAEVLLHEVLEHQRDGASSITPEQLTQLRLALGDPAADLWPAALNLIGEGGVLDVSETAAGGLQFILMALQPLRLPPSIQQAARQHGIPLATVQRLYHQWHALVELDEASFIRQCLREQEPRPLSRHWQPGQFCKAGLYQRGISETFVADLVPEFVLIFNEQPRAALSLDLEFFRFATARWRRYVNSFDDSTDLRPLPERWEPGAVVRRELAQRGITTEQIAHWLPEFRLRKHESGQLSRQWGAEFLRFCTQTTKAS